MVRGLGIVLLHGVPGLPVRVILIAGQAAGQNHSPM